MKNTRRGKPRSPEMPSEVEDELRQLTRHLAEDLDDAGLDAQLLVAFREARDTGTVPADAGFFLVAHILLAMADEALAADARVRALSGELEALERDAGLREDEFWAPDEIPEEWEALVLEYETACDEARAAFFRDAGEEMMAEVFLHDRNTFIRQFESGRRFFHGLPMLPSYVN
ncbi:hypothetical protein [Stigmatella aurantiaca]|uniref:Conserved uncharacterized protein n=1 Tax=Stigmatella aurantiaca (strain DW4/3-1) TaxID=378806 RepID=Q093H4_STIAD|nr:hypothetical protein [Stigmatella aurantiaca]ADO75957.1 conserved uncharacterized protein [Stigmatella aurantiaca DW4/3-1]EAU66869.1 hypothetical protein STIAU_3201 [Stigmatella aurantiaca DW4/3-1]